MVQISNGIWNWAVWHLKTGQNVRHLVFTKWNPDYLVWILNGLVFRCFGLKLKSNHLKTGPFVIWPSKSPYFECFGILKGLVSDPHCFPALGYNCTFLLPHFTRKLLIGTSLYYYNQKMYFRSRPFWECDCCNLSYTTLNWQFLQCKFLHGFAWNHAKNCSEICT